MGATAVQYYRPAGRLARLVQSVWEPSNQPAELSSVADLVAILRLVLAEPCQAIRLAIRPFCVTDANPAVGRAVGGIGYFSYAVECLATVEPARPQNLFSPADDDSRQLPFILRELNTNRLRYQEGVPTRFGSQIGSRAGKADEHLRLEAEAACVGRATVLQARFAKHFSNEGRLTITG